MTYTDEMAHAAAARGAAWLDKQYPNWVDEINLDRLNIASPTFCVLGQTAKCLLGRPNPKKTAMRNGYDAVRFQHPTIRHRVGWAWKNGFTPEQFDEWKTGAEMLTLAWKVLIRERRGL